MNALAYPFWLASRAAGITAYLLLSLSVTIGLLLALRRLRPVRGALRIAHERIALLALGAVAAHGLVLLGDSWLHPSAAQLLVPFAMPYRPFWTGLGVLAAYAAAGLGLTYYLRRRLGARRWRHAHRFIPVAWALAVAHVIGAGTDGRSDWMLVPIGITVVAAGWLLAERWLGTPAARPARSSA